MWDTFKHSNLYMTTGVQPLPNVANSNNLETLKALQFTTAVKLNSMWPATIMQ